MEKDIFHQFFWVILIKQQLTGGQTCGQAGRQAGSQAARQPGSQADKGSNLRAKSKSNCKNYTVLTKAARCSSEGEYNGITGAEWLTRLAVEYMGVIMC